MAHITRNPQRRTAICPFHKFADTSVLPCQTNYMRPLRKMPHQGVPVLSEMVSLRGLFVSGKALSRRNIANISRGSNAARREKSRKTTVER